MVTTFTLDPFKDPFFADWNKMFGTAASAPVKTYPPYNVVKINDDKVVMEFAVAGFSRKDIDITTEKNVLTIKGEKPETDEKEYLHKGIAARKFTRSFTLPEFYEVESAGYEDGILYIDLIKNVPEEKKPKSIKIK
jgi:molecular chaperone IbpA